MPDNNDDDDNDYDNDDDNAQIGELIGIHMLMSKIKEEVPETDKRHKTIIGLCSTLEEMIMMYAGLSDLK
jgi:hypothetical protein